MFLDLFDLHSENSPILHNHLNNNFVSAYELTSPDIQNEMLAVELQFKCLRKQMILSDWLRSSYRR